MKKLIFILLCFFAISAKSQLVSFIIRNDTLIAKNPSTGTERVIGVAASGGIPTDSSVLYSNRNNYLQAQLDSIGVLSIDSTNTPLAKLTGADLKIISIGFDNSSTVSSSLTTDTDSTKKWTFSVVDASITNAKLATMPANTLSGNNTGSTATRVDLTVSQVRTMIGLDTLVRTLQQVTEAGLSTDQAVLFEYQAEFLDSVFASGFKNILKTKNLTQNNRIYLPNSSGYLGNKVRVNGTTYDADVNGLVDLGTVSGGGGVSDGDKGDITVSGSGTTYTIDANAVTTSKVADANITKAKIENVAVGNVLGRSSTTAGAPEEVGVPIVLATGSASSVASLDLDLSNWYTVYDVITIELYGVRPATDGAIARIRVSSDGTTFASGASNYKYGFKYVTGGGAEGVGGTSETYIAASGTGTGVDNASTSDFTATIKVSNPNVSSVYPVLKIDAGYFNSAGEYFWFSGGGSRQAAQVCRGIQLSFSTGNISAAKYKIIGIKNN